MQKILMVLTLVFLASCSQSLIESPSLMEDVSKTPLQSTPAADAIPVFGPSSFSKAISISTDGKFLRFDFDFFPDGRTVDFKNKSVAIPCSFVSHVPEGVDVELSAPIEAPCSEPYRIDFNGSGEALTLEGIVVPVEVAKEKFVEAFGFFVKADGVEDSFDGSKIQTGMGRLQDYYDAVLAKHPITP